MTDRSLFVRLSDAFILARDLYREVKLDLRCIVRDDWRGAVLLLVLAFGVGVWIG